MSRGKKLLILLAVLAVVIAGVLLVIHFAGKSDSGSTSNKLSVVDTEDIKSVKWTYEDKTFELVPDGDDDMWIVSGMEDLDIDPSAATNMVSVVSNLYAQKEVAKEISDEAAYGFDAPEVIVVVKTDAGETTLTLGNFNETAGYYYLKSSESASLWYVDSQLHSAFAAGALDLVKRESLPSIESGDVSFVSISNKDKEYQLENDVSGADDDAGAAVNFTLKGSDIKIDNTVVSGMVTAFDNISWSKVVSVDAKSADLSEYGLDKPQLTFSMTYSYETEDVEAPTGEDGKYPMQTLTETSELLIGTAAEKEHDDDVDQYYAMLKNGKNIYTVSDTTAKKFLVDYPTALYDLNIVNIESADVSGLSVTYKNTVYDITVDTDTATDANGSETTETVYKIDGKEIELDEFTGLVTALKATSISDTVIDNPGDVIISVTLNDSDGGSTGIVIYELPDNSSACAVQVGNVIRMTADYIDCDNIADAFRDALAGMEKS